MRGKASGAIYWLFFLIVFIFLLSFFAETGPLVLIKDIFLIGYRSLPGPTNAFGTRDLLALAVVYFCWYFFISAVSYVSYLIRRRVGLKIAEKEGEGE